MVSDLAEVFFFVLALFILQIWLRVTSPTVPEGICQERRNASAITAHGPPDNLCILYPTYPKYTKQRPSAKFHEERKNRVLFQAYMAYMP